MHNKEEHVKGSVKIIFFIAITPGTTSQLEHYIVSVL